VAGCAGSATSSTSSTTGAEGSALVSTDRGESDGAATRPSLEGYTPVAELPDIHFDFDRYDVRADAAKVLDKGARWLQAHPSHLVLVEGHADERGTNEYNMALGERRAKASMNYLVSRGVPASRITVISYGEERGLCSEHTEGCWAKNRRAHFGVKSRD
jgi:peptidoglycan-associated lipoprotein